MPKWIADLAPVEWLTAVLVLVTGFYAWATFRILRANESVVSVMKEQGEALTRPYIIVRPELEPDNPIFYLRIKNSGKTPARNLRLSLDEKYAAFAARAKDRDLSNLAAFANSIDSFAPGAEIVFLLGSGLVIFQPDQAGEKLPPVFHVGVEYEYGDGKLASESHPIDVRPYLAADIPQDATIRKLKDIREALKAIAKNTSGSP